MTLYKLLETFNGEPAVSLFKVPQTWHRNLSQELQHCRTIDDSKILNVIESFTQQSLQDGVLQVYSSVQAYNFKCMDFHSVDFGSDHGCCDFP